jgi:hypothetical protein
VRNAHLGPHRIASLALDPKDHSASDRRIVQTREPAVLIGVEFDVACDERAGRWWSDEHRVAELDVEVEIVVIDG